MQWLPRKRFDSSASYAVAVRSKGCWWSNERMQVKLLPSHFWGTFGFDCAQVLVQEGAREGFESLVLHLMAS